MVIPEEREQLRRTRGRNRVWTSIVAFIRSPLHTTRNAIASIRYLWNTSMQVRLLLSVIMASLLVLSVLGLFLVTFLGQQLLQSKTNSAIEELDRARIVVQDVIGVANTGNSATVQLTAARTALTERAGRAEAGRLAIYEPVLVTTDFNSGEVIVPETAQISRQLREFVRQGQVATQYVTLPGANGEQAKFLVIGSPVETDLPNTELYLIFPLETEENTLALVRGLLLGGSIVLEVLLMLIVWAFSQQVTQPVRQAARVAERFSAGHLRERMMINGQDEMARLALNFNDMAEKLSTQIRNLEEFGDLQRQFTSDVSHELRTPLTTVRMAADLIHDNAENLDPLTARASELMNKELDRFESLLGDLLEISRHDAGVANLSNEVVDIRGIIRSAREQVRAIAEEAGADVRLHLPEEPITLEIDSRRVERIVRNLLANAVDHSEGRPVDVTLGTNETAVSVTVVDHGVGLKPGEEEMVFNRFWRADPSRERRTGGTGLGLAIAREDALLHGGKLDATGVPGQGACFRLTLPITPGQPFAAAPLPLAVDAAFFEQGNTTTDVTDEEQPEALPETPEPVDSGDESLPAGESHDQTYEDSHGQPHDDSHDKPHDDEEFSESELEAAESQWLAEAEEAADDEPEELAEEPTEPQGGTQ